MSERVRVPDLIRMRRRDRKISMLTAYDYLFAQIVDNAGIDIILVGDSLASVVQGHETTLPVTLDEVIYHSKMVVRGVKRALVVADMPFMSFQTGAREALDAAGRLVKEAGVSAVKLEGGESAADAIRRIVGAGIPVMGHVGLTPQSYHRMGGHRVQGKKPREADRIIDDALCVQEAGAFAVVLEGIPGEVAEQVTEMLTIPTIGIGAGVECSGQVLVLHDMLGLTEFEGGREPRFLKRYANLRDEVTASIKSFAEDVSAERFPGPENTYEMEKPALREVTGTRDK